MRQRQGSGLRVLLDIVVLAAEAMHIECPLQTDDRTLDRAQQPHRQGDRQRNPDCQVLQVESVLVASTPMKAPTTMWPTMTTTR